MKEKLLKTPQGSESIFLEEAYKHEKIIETINNLYTNWGYLPVKTPVFDYYETYEKLLSDTSKKNCFRLMDRNGDLLLLRNDITLFLARQLGRILKNSNETIRVHYSDSILRHQSEIDISSNEFFQTGAELVGKPGLYGDLEAITLLNTILTDLKLPDTKIHIGSRALLDSLLKNFKNIDSSTLIELIDSRDIKKLENYLLLDNSNKIATDITNLLLFIGTFNEFSAYKKENRELIEKLGLTNDFKHLEEIGENLKGLGLIDDFRFDLSEVTNKSYYTGIVFKAYTKGIDSAIASGGRYDNLISTFGKSIPSVGFSILLRKIEGKILDEKFIAPTKNYININNNYITAYNEAKKTRESGSVAVLKGDK